MKYKYYLIKAKHDLHTNNCYTAITDDIQPDEIVSYVELTEEEIKNMLLGLCGGDGEYWSDTGEIEKLRNML